jgi:hypothetical protein
MGGGGSGWFTFLPGSKTQFWYGHTFDPNEKLSLGCVVPPKLKHTLSPLEWISAVLEPRKRRKGEKRKGDQQKRTDVLALCISGAQCNRDVQTNRCFRNSTL